MFRYSLIISLLLLVGCHTLRPKPDLFPPEPRVWSLIPRDATLVAALNVQEALKVAEGLFRSGNWDPKSPIRSVKHLRARFRAVLGIDPGLVKKSVLVTQLAVTGYYGGFLLYGIPKAFRPSKAVGRYRGRKLYRTRLFYAARIEDVVVLGDRRFVQKVLDLRYGLGRSISVTSSLWLHHETDLDRSLLGHIAVVADLKMLSERFSYFRRFKLNYFAGMLDVNRGGLILFDSDSYKLMRAFEKKLLKARKMLLGLLGLARLKPGGLKVGRLRLQRRDFTLLLDVIKRTRIQRKHRVMRLSIKGKLVNNASLVLKLMLVSLNLVEDAMKNKP